MASTAPLAGKSASRPAAELPRVSMPSSSPAFYRGGNIIWDTRRQPNFVPENFIRIRNKSQAWFYKVTTVAMIVLICWGVYGAYLGYQYYQLDTEEKKLSKELIVARKKERDAQAKAKELYGKISVVDKKVAYDAIRQPTAKVIYEIAKRLPEQFYVQNLSLISEDSVKDKNGGTINISQKQKGLEMYSFNNAVTLNAKIVGVDATATESLLMAAFQGLQGFRVLSSQTAAKGGGIEVTVQYMSTAEFIFDAPPKHLLPK